MSPEQCAGDPVDESTDIYAIGCSMFEALSGYVPFEGASALEAAIMHQEAEPPLLSEVIPGKPCSRSIELVIDKCLAKLPRDRYQSAKELHLDLERLKDGKVVRATEQAFRTERSNEKSEKSKELKLLLIPLVIIVLLLFVGGAGAFWWNSDGSKKIYESQSNKINTPAAENSTAGNIFIDQVQQRHNSDILDHDEAERKYAQLYLQSHSGFYSSEIVGNGQKYKRFDFPEKFSIGWVNYSEPVRAGKTQTGNAQARGTILLNPSTRIRLRASHITSIYPDLLSRFRPSDLDWLIVDASQNSAKLILSVSRLTSLQTLDLNHASTSLRTLSALKNLKSLILLSCEADTSTLLQSKLLSQLEYFAATGTDSASALLKAFDLSPN